MSKANDYLEGIFKDAYKRELDVDENVARTLPFFAASLALGATLFRYIISRMPVLAVEFYSLTMHALLLGSGLLLILILWWLLQAVRVREYRLPPREPDQLAWSAALAEHFKSTGLKHDAVDQRVEEMLRETMLQEYAASAVHNRDANKPKLQARAFGFTYLVALLAVAFFMIGLIFVEDRVTGSAGEEPTHGRTEASGEQRPIREEGRDSASTGTAGGESRREVPGVAGGEHRPSDGGKEVSSNDTSPAGGQQPAQSPAPSAPPPPPPHQLLKKSMTDTSEKR